MIETLRRILSQGFRAFFLGAGGFALLSMLFWEYWQWAGGPAAVFEAAISPFQWHSHEMVFGYAAAAVAGFLLTAVPNWTGSGPARRGFIAAAFGLWLAGRLALWFSGLLPPWLVAVADLAFVPVLAARVLAQLMRRPKPQNMMFLLFLAILWAGDVMIQLDWTGLWPGLYETGIRIGLLALCIMIGVIGGRVIPAFTRNAMRREGQESDLPVSHPLAERAGLVLLISLPFAFAASAALAGGLAVLAGAVQLVRLSGWRSGWSLRQPILWALHLPFALLGIGLILLGAAWLGWGDELAAIHLLGIGTVAGMTVAVMSRAILGHTGRALHAGPPLVAAYVLIPVAALLRWSGSAFPGGGWHDTAVLMAGALWIIAFALFLVALWPALSRPRVVKPAA